MSQMSSFKLPCGSKNYYPEKLDYLTRKGSYVIFHTQSEIDSKAYLVNTLKKGINILSVGTAMKIVQQYESIDLPEHQISDINGIFFYKYTETQNEFESAISELAKVD